MDYVIYKHTNTLNNKVYIGMTNNTKRRWRCNGVEYKPDKKSNPLCRPFWNAINKYGWNSFVSEIIESGLTFSEAIEREKYYIKLYDSTNKQKGYNASYGGNGGKIYLVHPRGMLGKKHSDTLKENHRIHMSDRKNNPMYNGKTIWGVTHEHPRGMLGKKHSDDFKKRLSIRFKGGNHPNAKKIYAYLNGETYIFGYKKECLDYFGISDAFYYKLLKSCKPYELSNTKKNDEKFKKLVGLIISLKSLENTEVS